MNKKLQQLRVLAAFELVAEQLELSESNRSNITKACFPAMDRMFVSVSDGCVENIKRIRIEDQTEKSRIHSAAGVIAKAQGRTLQSVLADIE